MAKKHSRAYRHQSTPSSITAAVSTVSTVTPVGYTALTIQFPPERNRPANTAVQAVVCFQPCSFLHSTAKTTPSASSATPIPIRMGMAASQLSIWSMLPLT